MRLTLLTKRIDKCHRVRPRDLRAGPTRNRNRKIGWGLKPLSKHWHANRVSNRGVVILRADKQNTELIGQHINTTERIVDDGRAKGFARPVKLRHHPYVRRMPDVVLDD